MIRSGFYKIDDGILRFLLLLLSYFSFSLYFLAYSSLLLLYFFFTFSLLLRSIDPWLRYDTPAPCVILLIIGFLSQLLDDRVEVRDDAKNAGLFLSIGFHMFLTNVINSFGINPLCNGGRVSWVATARAAWMGLTFENGC